MSGLDQASSHPSGRWRERFRGTLNACGAALVACGRELPDQRGRRRLAAALIFEPEAHAVADLSGADALGGEALHDGVDTALLQHVGQPARVDRLGAAGEEFKRWAIEDLTAYARYAYDPDENAFRATLIDGTRLTPADRKREGYVEARWLEKRPATGLHLWAYALAYRLSGDERMWRMTRAIARGLGLGDPGEKAGAVAAANFNTADTEPETIFALLELHKATRRDEFLRLAQRVGDNLMKREYHGGFFVANREAPFCRLDSITPLALLHLEAAVRKLPVRLPEYEAGRAYFHCSFEGKGRTRDNQVLYGELPKAPGELPRAPRASATTRPVAS